MKAKYVIAQNIQYFLRCARKSSLHQAAKDLNVSVPTLSIALSQLEKNIGVKLFERNRNGIRLTAKGVEFYASLEKSLDNIERQLESLTAGSEPLRIGAGGHLGPRFVFPALAKKHEELPRLEYVVDRSNGLVQRVESGSLDCAFVVTPEKPRGVKSTLLWGDPIGIVGLKSIFPELSAAKSFAEVKNLPWLVDEREGSIPELGTSTVNEAVVFANSTVSVKDLVLAGACVAEVHLGFFSSNEMKQLAIAPFTYFSQKMHAYFVQPLGKSARKMEMETVLERVRNFAKHIS